MPADSHYHSPQHLQSTKIVEEGLASRRHRVPLHGNRQMYHAGLYGVYSP